MSTEQQRAEFEVWHEETFGWSPRYFDEIGVYSATAQERWLSYQSGRAALQSQDREDAERLEWLVEAMGRLDMDEGHRGWFILERDTSRYVAEDCKTFREAIDHARRIEGGNHANS